MTNFQKFKRNITPEQLARWVSCGECPLYDNGCDGFSSLYENNQYETCINKLVAWFNQETK